MISFVQSELRRIFKKTEGKEYMVYYTNMVFLEAFFTEFK